MKVNLPQQYPTAQVPKSGKAIARQEQAAGSIAPTQRVQTHIQHSDPLGLAAKVKRRPSTCMTV